MTKLIIAIGLISGSCFSSMFAAEATNVVDKAALEIRRIGDSGKYSFVLFHKSGDNATNAQEAVSKAVQGSGGRAEAVIIDVADKASEKTVLAYGVNRAPLPLVLAIAPNGAVTGGFSSPSDENALLDAMTGPKAAACLKTLQEGKVVLVCLQPAGSTNVAANSKTIAAFKEDERIAGFAESMVFDPLDKAEKSFLVKLPVDPASNLDMTLLVMPPGLIVGVYTNVISKETMFADLSRAMAGATCGSGGGCGPAAGGCR